MEGTIKKNTCHFISADSRGLTFHEDEEEKKAAAESASSNECLLQRRKLIKEIYGEIFRVAGLGFLKFTKLEAGKEDIESTSARQLIRNQKNVLLGCEAKAYNILWDSSSSKIYGCYFR